MNKTVLLACCDFLILATLSFNHGIQNKVSHDNEPLIQSNDFAIIEEPNEVSQISQIALYEKQLNILKEENKELLKHKAESKNKINSLKNDLNKLSEINNTLTKLQLPTNESLNEAIQESRLQINSSMTEDDSVSPDKFHHSFYSSAFIHQGKKYLPAHFDSLGLSWSELIHDGHIMELKLTLAKRGKNPWSSSLKSPLKSLNQSPSILLLPIPDNSKIKHLKLVPPEHVLNSLDNTLYIAQTNGRINKVYQASVLPHAPGILEINEERFLGRPEKLSKGDLIMNNKGHLLAIITKTQVEGNRLRHFGRILSTLDFSNSSIVPIIKEADQKYFSEFVKKIRLIKSKIVD